MKHNFETLMASARTVALSKKERASLRARILENAQDAAIVQQPVPSRWVSVLFTHRYVGVFSVFFLLFFTAGGSLLAEQALPGDLLYGVKTNVNEKVLGWFADSDERRAEWHLELADRRLEEIERLSDTHELSEDVRSGLSGQIAVHMKSVLGDQYESEFKVLSEEMPPDHSEDGLEMKETPTLSARSSEAQSSLEDDSSEASMLMAASLSSSAPQSDEAFFTSTLPELKRLLGEEGVLQKKDYLRAKSLLIVATSLHLEAKTLWQDGREEEASQLWKKAERIIEDLASLAEYPLPDRFSPEGSGEEERPGEKTILPAADDTDTREDLNFTKEDFQEGTSSLREEPSVLPESPLSP